MQFSSLSITQLKVLATILEHQNLTRAATELGSSQSVLSKQLAQFREAFSDPLLTRQGGKYLLTEHAAALMEPLNRILADLDDLGQPKVFIPEHCTRRFRIAGSDYVAEHILPELIRKLSRIAPEVRVDYRTWQPNRFDWLSSGQVDLVTSMVEDAPADFHGKVIGDDIPVCCLHSEHPLAAKQQIDFNDYLQWDHLKITGGGDKDSFIDNYLRECDARRKIRLEVPFFSVALDIVAESEHLLTIPRHLAERSAQNRPLIWRPLGFLSYRFRYWVMWHRRTHLSAEQQWFRHLVYQHCQVSQALNPEPLPDAPPCL